MSSEKKTSVRSLLSNLHDSQGTVEATHYAEQVVERAEEDITSVSEFIHCGHVDWDDLLAEKMKAAGWRGGRLSVTGGPTIGGKVVLTKEKPS